MGEVERGGQKVIWHLPTVGSSDGVVVVEVLRFVRELGHLRPGMLVLYWKFRRRPEVPHLFHDVIRPVRMHLHPFT
jgi:hypothetical protein